MQRRHALARPLPTENAFLASYTDVHKDICKDEFAKFGQCLREAVCMRLTWLACVFISFLR
ncbi:hypothetical protein BT96DRAFT_11370 [Gymnopus androsaceus JB14]|uniref:Uncharacterized protein n=1 Tax=Gymnopus androsaceus JB14 TaxID=1447944 RepID=A0A6A4IGD3_9AGAR|nr:hypothetical protein BT96DRAFT_11370 [Gymnopus androsaceus JB14]